jgi:hypothetical protein
MLVLVVISVVGQHIDDRDVFSAVVAVLATATGPLLLPVVVTATTWLAVAPLSSVTVAMKLSVFDSPSTNLSAELLAVLSNV